MALSFSDTDNKNGILQLIERKLGMRDGEITNSTILKAYFTELVNNWLGLVTNWIQLVDNEWSYDDQNHGDFPIETFYFYTVLSSTDTSLMTVGDTITGQTSGATGVIRAISDDTSLSITVTSGMFEAEEVQDEDTNACTVTAVAYQQDYGLSTDGEKDSWVIRKIEIRDASTEDFEEILIRSQNQILENPYDQTSGKPTTCWFEGGSIFFDPPPDTGKADQYRLAYDRGGHLFLTTDTTAKPGFDKGFHMILVYGPSMDWAATKGADFRDIFNDCYIQIFGDGRRPGLKEEMEKFYFRRSNLLSPVVVESQEENF